MRKVTNRIRKKPEAETQPWFNPEHSMLFLHLGLWDLQRVVEVGGTDGPRTRGEEEL